MLAGAQRGQGGLEVRLGRRADGDRVELLHLGQQGLDVGEVRHAIDVRIATGAGHELEAGVGSERRNVLIAGDLADADQGQLQGHAYLWKWRQLDAGLHGSFTC